MSDLINLTTAIIGLASAIIYLISHFLQLRRSRKEKKSDHNSPKEIS